MYRSSDRRWQALYDTLEEDYEVAKRLHAAATPTDGAAGQLVNLALEVKRLARTCEVAVRTTALLDVESELYEHAQKAREILTRRLRARGVEGY